MVLKKPQKKTHVTPYQADTLANDLAGKPYGKKKTSPKIHSDRELARTTISLPKQLFEQIEDLAIANKRQGEDPKSISAIVRDALYLYLD